MKLFSFWTDMDEGRKTRIRKICGLVVLVFALFTLLSTVSYLFTWKADQSLHMDPDKMDYAIDAANAAGKLGAEWSYLLVGRWFGLGAFALVLMLFFIAIRLLSKKKFSLVKAILLTLTGAVVVSFISAFISRLAGLDTVLDGGLGGECGKEVISWLKNLFHNFVTGLLLLIMLVFWLMCASKKFSDWFTGIGRNKEVSEADNQGVTEDKPKKKRGFKWGPSKKEEEEEDQDDEDIIGPTPPINPVPTDGLMGGQDIAVPDPDDMIDSGHDTPPEPKTPEPKTPKVPTPPQTPVNPKIVTPEEADQIDVESGGELSTDVVEDLPRIDVREDLSNYRFPPLTLLEDYEGQRHEVPEEELKRNNYKIRATLKTYKIDVDNVTAVVGPTVTLYKVYPAPGVKISAIKNLQNEIAMAMRAKGVRVVTLEDSVGIEVANDHPSIVPLKAMLNDDAFRYSKAELPVAMGYTIQQKVKVFDLTDAPHLLVAGATKQGKSVGLNVLITSLLYAKHPSELKFVFIDPKMVEFSAYAGLLHHYLAVLPNAANDEEEMMNAICKTPKQSDLILKSLCIEMDARYELMGKALVNKVTLYNEKFKDRHLLPTEGHRYMPYIVVVVDEYADLTMSGGTGDSKAMARSISSSIIRLAQKGRAAGIHIVLATQRPSVDVVTGLIKTNFPTRIAFRVISSVDSKTILDSPGAEKLIGRGDMIYYAGVDMERIQCAFINNEEINKINEFISEQKGYKKSYNTPYYLPMPETEQGEEGTAMIDMKNLDDRFEEAARQVVMTQRGSTSDLQRKLGMGYAKAGRVMDQLEAAGIVGPQEGSKPRQVLVSDLSELEGIIEAFKNASN